MKSLLHLAFTALLLTARPGSTAAEAAELTVGSASMTVSTPQVPAGERIL